ncbi:HTTM domain-containing protein [Flectobacillus sp. DC10W]|uniref:HTTM domain-containing protein n=1 Tax=Flectobacillus longus TaxID=2984207 RepID=A0ABT6YHA6_9BACT|nr:HTTM domain-containing protein [Flectobacillus longus]MDI9862964.1 HTTM domain-containing protein [Flectobacillus longus]
MKNLRLNFHQFFFKPVDQFPLVFLRISIGLFGLLQCGFLSSEWLNLYGVNGYVEWFISYDLFSIKELPSIVGLANFLIPLGITDNMVVILITCIYVIALLGITLGWHTKIMVVTAWLSHFMLCNTAMTFGYGVETFLHVGLFYLIFAPCNFYLSLDKLQGRGAEVSVTPNAKFIIRIIQIHLCLVYFNAGIAKMMGDDWLQGEAVWYVIGNTNYSQFDLSFLASIPIIPKLMSWWTLVIETAFPVFIYWKPSRSLWAINIIFLHIGIGLLMGLNMFALIMIILNIGAFWWQIFPTFWDTFKTRCTNLNAFGFQPFLNIKINLGK